MSDTMTKEEKLELKEEQAELKAALDVSSAQNRNLLIFFLAFLLYITMILLQTTDLMLLLPDTFGVVLPIFGVEVPVLVFSIFAPLILIFLHFNLLFNLNSHHQKLEKWMPEFKEDQALILYPFFYNQIFPFSTKALVQNKSYFISFIFIIFYFLLPLVLLFVFLVKFYSYQDAILTAWHVVCLFIMSYFYMYYGRLILPQKTGSPEKGKYYFSYIGLLLWAILILHKFYNPDVLFFNKYIFSLQTPDLDFPSLYEAHKNKLLAQGQKNFSLKGRSLKNINLENAIFCSFDKNIEQRRCFVLFDGNTDLSGANFRKANLQGIKFYSYDLEKDNLSNVKTQNIIPEYANITDANFREANLQGVSFYGNKLTSAHFSFAWFKPSTVNDNFIELYRAKRNEFQDKKFRCLDYIHFVKTLYHHWEGVDLEQANVLLDDLNKVKCPNESINFVKSNPENWNFNNFDHREQRRILFATIKANL